MALKTVSVMLLQALQAPRIHQAVFGHVKDLHRSGGMAIRAVLEPVRLFSFSFLTLGGKVAVASYVKYKTAWWTVGCCDLGDLANHLRVARSRQVYIELAVEALLILSFYLRNEQILIDIGNTIVGSSYPFHHSVGPVQLSLSRRRRHQYTY
jgi:hypothetical protein